MAGGKKKKRKSAAARKRKQTRAAARKRTQPRPISGQKGGRPFPASGGQKGRRPFSAGSAVRRAGRFFAFAGPEKRRSLATLAAVLLQPALLLLLSRYLGLQRLGDLAGSPAWGAEYLLLLGPALLLWAAFGRAWAVWLAEGVPLLLLSLVNYYKLRINGTPLEPGDFSLISGAGEILNFALPQLRLSLPTVLTLVIWAALLAGSILLRRLLRPAKRPRLLALALGVLLTGALLTGFAAPKETAGAGPVLRLYAAWAARQDHRDPADEELLESIRQQMNATPTPAPTPAPTPKATPEPGSEPGTEPAPTPEPTPEPVPLPETPTVIFLMSESFFDVTRLPGIAFDTDPLESFHALAAESSSGRFLSPTYCGGTGYVELEVLTGLCSALLRSGDTLTSLPEDCYERLPCIGDVFAARGYELTFLHSYNAKLYNRAVIYSGFGFDRILFDDSFPDDAEMRGNFISDEALSREILSLLDASEGPQMIFAVSMENHQPYNAAKYGEACASGLSSEVLGEDELTALDAYVHGAEDADAALALLVEGLEGREEPVMLVFWGDHLPNLSLPDGRNIYEELGCCTGTDTEAWGPEELAGMLCTDWLIWTNYGLPQEDRTESATLLGLHVLQALDFELTNYFRWLGNQIDGRYLMYRPRLFADAGWNLSRSIPAEYEHMMKAYAAVVYNIVYGSGELFGSEGRQTQ